MEIDWNNEYIRLAIIYIISSISVWIAFFGYYDDNKVIIIICYI